MTFAKKLREVRVSMDMSQAELTDYLLQRGVKISQSMIAMYELGKRTPQLNLFFAIASALGMTADELYGKEQDKSYGKRITGKLKAIPHKRKTLHARLVRKAERRTGVKS